MLMKRSITRLLIANNKQQQQQQRQQQQQQTNRQEWVAGGTLRRLTVRLVYIQ